MAASGQEVLEAVLVHTHPHEPVVHYMDDGRELEQTTTCHEHVHAHPPVPHLHEPEDEPGEHGIRPHVHDHDERPWI